MAFGFEPRYKKDEIKLREQEKHDADDIANSGRLTVLDWCRCANCIIMSTVKECVCCWESNLISEIRRENSCIILHDSFESIILNLDSLNMLRHTLILQCRMAEDKKKYSNVSNRLWRHLAYRNFICWINSWTSIGRHNRIVIPACVVREVRERFPEENGIYTGFKEFDDIN